MRRLGLVAVAFGLLAASDVKPATLLKDQAAFTRQLASLQADGAPVVVHFWATWCEACDEEFHTLAPALARLIKGGAKVMLVSLDPPELRSSVVPVYLEKHSVPGDSYLLEDADPEAMAKALDPKWPVGELPATFVFRDGKRVKSFFGPADAAAVVAAAGVVRKPASRD